MLVSAAVLPHPPMLVPEVAAGAAEELAPVRQACISALDALLQEDPDLVVVVGSADAPHRSFPAGAEGSFAGFEVPVRVRLPGADAGVETAGSELPTSLAVAAWLMTEQHRWPEVRGEAVPEGLAPADAADLGRRLAAESERVSLIAMGDGSAALSARAPGYLVDGADGWQRTVTDALGDADLDTLAALDPDDASHFVAAGRAAWQVLAGAARGKSWRSELLADDAPYGVAYLVASWTRLTS